MEQPPLIPREVLFGNPERVGVQISPDGKWISYLAPYEGVMNIWLQPRDGGEARPLTTFTDRPLPGYTWAYNSEQILFSRDNNGDENTHVYVVSIEDGKVDDLTPVDGVKAGIVEIHRDRPDEILISINDRDPQFSDYDIINTRTGERTKLIQNDEGFLGYFFDDKWSPLGRIKMTPEGGMLFEMQDQEGWFEYMNVPMEDSMTTQPTGISNTGDIVYGIDSRNRDTAALVSMPAERGGADKATVLFASDKADVSGSIMDPITKVPQGVVVNYLREEWTPLDDSITEDLEGIRKLGSGDFNITSRTRDDRLWTIAIVQDAGPVTYWIWDRDAKKGTYLFSHRPDLENYELAPMEAIEIPTRDGLTMTAYLTKPKNTTGPTPMVLLVHGGPWARDSWGYNPMHQWLADRGYAVLSPNFRGSTGFGKSFLNAGNRQWYAAMQDDLVDATNWAIENKIADSDRIAIMGGSYGGYATLAGLTRDPELYAAGVDIVGPSHVATLLETIPPYWKPMIRMFETRVGGLDEREYLDSISPLTHVDRIERPLLIAQGANDPRVKISESDQIVEAMESRDLPVTYVVFPDEGHGMRRPENNMAFNAITEEFLAKHLGGRVEPMGDIVSRSTAQVRARGNLELAGVADWEPEAVEAQPERAFVDRAQLTDLQLAQVQQGLEMIKAIPPDDLPKLLDTLESQRPTIPAEDLIAFDYMIQSVERAIALEQRKASSPEMP
ncbi:MAG: S9 family peptidase [Phycisphaerae bacterium]|nr:S9 family peptidase [Phycisphaerae bacterium]